MNAAPALSYRSFDVTFDAPDGAVHAVKTLDLEVRRGETLALVGESGSGKTLTALAALGLLPGAARASGSVEVMGEDVMSMSPHRLRELRGAGAAMVFQEPMTALNPLMRVGDQIAEVLLNHGRTKDVAQRRVVELLTQVGIPDPARRSRSFPHELSGGQRQRVVIAMALACEPAVIIADEPTTALDVTVQAEILGLLRDLQRDSGLSILLVTHNMGVVADLCDRVAVMYRGDLLEVGTSHQVLTEPRHEYTRRLLDAVPSLPRLDVVESVHDEPEGPSRTAPVTGGAVLAMHDLCVDYGRRGRAFRAVDGVDLSIGAGEFVGLVGESGSGKSTVGRVALGLLPPSSGRVELFGHDLATLRRRDALRVRRRIGVILQDPAASLDPRMSVGDCVAEPIAVHRALPRSRRRARVAELLDAVQLPKGAADRYPHELSGGQRQRVSLARALSLEPELLLADEPTSALDVLVQASVLDMLADLQQRYEFACLFISHDLAVVDSLTERVAVMRRGEIVEQGETARVLREPRHAYTRTLLAAAPVPDPHEQALRREAWRASA